MIIESKMAAEMVTIIYHDIRAGRKINQELKIGIRRQYFTTSEFQSSWYIYSNGVNVLVTNNTQMACKFKKSSRMVQ